ncbi:MAG: family 78 glycoside hydrolase catalytic domain [Sedimentisphaerales bacterium]|nr:family 78 glycoside hydrolase catalytic domain [Sedimentisphaerales bacterium]
MKTTHAILLAAAAFVCVGCAMTEELNIRSFGPGKALTAENLRCEYLVDPLGVDVAQPRLSWAVQSRTRGRMQSAYRILVASRPGLLADDTGDLWDSGRVASDESIQIPYGGAPLLSQMRCYWKVRVWDDDNQPSRWSKPASWTMGLLDPSDWKARWIGYDASRRRESAGREVDLSQAYWIWYPEGDAKASVPVGTRFFRREFVVGQGREITSALCAVTADNGFKTFLNGQEIGSGSNFKVTAVVDVKKHIRAGKNVLAVEANNAGDEPNPAGVLALLSLRFADGVMIVASDETWRVSKTGASDWTKGDFDAGNWDTARVAGPYGTRPWGQIDTTGGALILPPAQFLRSRFVLEKPVKRATLYASALGNYELHLNGRSVSDAYFSPGWTDYNIRVYYNTYDVTESVKPGFNALGAILADGWYSGHIGWGRKRDHYGQNPRFAAQLHVEFADGSSKTIATGKTWKAATGPILEGDFLMGETYDARAEMPGWSTADFDDADWQPVDVTDRIDAAVEAYPGVPVRAVRQIEPVARTEPTDGAYVFDLGANFAGFARLLVRNAEPGQKIVLRFAERLNPDGTIYTTNLRGARAIDTYICKGTGKEIWQPRFTFHGFQYVEVTGYPGTPGLDAVTGVELTSDTPVVGDFTCSDEMTNTLYRNICQTQRANFIDIPTDCPQRDERLGWMGDAQIYVRTATYNTDVSAFFTKWMVDVEDAQLDNGAFTDVSPRKVAEGGGTAAWGDAGVICPWTIYQVYGDKRILAEHYDAMQEWVDYCKGTTKGTLLRPAQGYGDWLSIKADTPKDVLATAYFACSTKLTAQVAEVLGKREDARRYQQLYEDIRTAFNEAYVSEAGRIKGDTQTVYVLALAFDLLPKNKRETVTQYLADDIRQRNWHLSTGFVGTKDLMTTLTRFGRTDVAYHLFHNETFPSWGFSIKHGATSIWERWDGWTPENGFQDPGMNSFAHYSFGAVCEWMFKTIGGIDTAMTPGPAYKNIIIRPRPGGRLTWARTRYDSIRGTIATAWKRTDEALALEVTIPANTNATLYLPALDLAGITESGKPVLEADGVRFIGMLDGNAVFEIGSGNYRFRAPRL